MTDDSCRTPDVDKRMTRLVISPEISTGLASKSISSSSLLEAAAVNDDELKQVDSFRGQVLEEPWTCRNISCGNANIKGEATEYETCNRETILERENSDPDTEHRDWCGMPEELLLDILLRLPVVSLIRLRSVCKSLHALIGTSAFIAQHSNRNHGEDSLIAIDHSIDDQSNKLCLLSGSKYEVYSDTECELEWKGQETTIGNCCNGIVCIVNSVRGSVELWNPALKQKKRLPESWVPTSSTLEFVWGYHWMCGFGYDSASNDYKAVKVHLTEEKGGARKSVVEVYSLRSDSWKIIQEAFPAHRFVYNRMARQTLSMNGKCYWIARVESVDICNEVLVSFDLNDERFETMALPAPDEANLDTPFHALDLLGGKLVCIKGTGNDWPYDAIHPTYYQIWVLEDEEDGATKCWSKLCDLGPTTYQCFVNRVPQAFSRDGQYLLLSDNPGMLQGIHFYNLAAGEYSYKFATREDDDIVIHDPKLILLSFDHYTESLVSLK